MAYSAFDKQLLLSGSDKVIQEFRFIHSMINQGCSQSVLIKKILKSFGLIFPIVRCSITCSRSVAVRGLRGQTGHSPDLVLPKSFYLANYLANSSIYPSSILLYAYFHLHWLRQHEENRFVLVSRLILTTSSQAVGHDVECFLTNNHLFRYCGEE